MSDLNCKAQQEPELKRIYDSFAVTLSDQEVLLTQIENKLQSIFPVSPKVEVVSEKNLDGSSAVAMFWKLHAGAHDNKNRLEEIRNRLDSLV